MSRFLPLITCVFVGMAATLLSSCARYPVPQPTATPPSAGLAYKSGSAAGLHHGPPLGAQVLRAIRLRQLVADGTRDGRADSSYAALLAITQAQAQQIDRPAKRGRAAETKVIAMSCDGTLTDTSHGDPHGKQEPMQKMGVVVNLNERTVSFLGYVARINDVNAANIKFGGPQIGGHHEGFDISIMGSVDRVTGHMDATTTTLDPTKKPSDPNAVTFRYDVLCKMTTSLF
jgi:hypothetical protein